jgi:hypothetical protein
MCILLIFITYSVVYDRAAQSPSAEFASCLKILMMTLRIIFLLYYY